MILQQFSIPCVAQNNKLVKLHYTFLGKKPRNLGTDYHFWQSQCISVLTLVTFYSSACFTSQDIYIYLGKSRKDSLSRY